MQWWEILGQEIVEAAAEKIVGMALDLVLDWAIEFLIVSLL